MQPIDAPRVRPNKRKQEQQAYAAEQAMVEATKPTARDRPAWFPGEPGAKAHLPLRPPPHKEQG